MKAIIVGHGPSMMLEKMGHLIDEFDIVIRLKRCQKTLKHFEYYGSKTSVVAGSLTIAGALREVKADQYWVFVDSRHSDIDQAVIDNIPNIFKPKPCILDKALCDSWDEIYRSKRDDMGGQGHAHTSQGFKAILYALHFLKPDELILVGFDNIFTGDFTWSVTRGPKWKHYPDHRWDVENELLDDLKKAYDIPIGFLLPEDETCAS